jgi:hypothetical protein
MKREIFIWSSVCFFLLCVIACVLVFGIENFYKARQGKMRSGQISVIYFD